MARQAYDLFQNALKTGQYAGSSGLYDYEDNLTSSPYDISRTGMGYAGDVAKNSIASRYNLTPQSVGTGSDSWLSGAGTGNDYAVLGQDGRWYSSRTGKIFSGTDAKTGKAYNNGYEQQNVNDRYQAVNVVKDPAVSDATADLLKTFKSNAASALKGFDDHLSDFTSDIAIARAKGNQALDTTGFEADLRGGQNRYNAALEAAKTGYQDLNTQNAAAENALVKQAYDTLPQYDAAAQAVGDRQLASLNRNLSKYKLGTDTARSLSSSDQDVLARNVADVQLPLEQQKIAEKLNLIQNLSLPVQRELYGNERSRITQFDPQIAQQEFSSGQATAQTIQGVRQQVAQMAPGLAVQYMQALGVPAQLQQQILSGQLGQLGQIGQLNEMSNYRGLQDLQGAYPSQVQSYNMNVPGYPGAQSPVQRYPASTNSLGGYGGAGQGPIQVSPTGGGTSNGQYNPYAIDPTTGLMAWQMRQRAGQSSSDANSGRGQFAGNYSNAQGNSYYDAATGTLRDRTTGEITGYPNADFNGGADASSLITSADQG